MDPVKNDICPLPKFPLGAPKTEAEWKKVLTPEQYRILRQKGTEPAFSGVYADNHEPGVYHCAACGVVLFKSQDKFDSGTGWPSFLRPAETLDVRRLTSDEKGVFGVAASDVQRLTSAKHTNVAFREDHSHGMKRTEVFCRVCGGHLGHVFNDGPAPTGERFCINSTALEFRK